MNKLYRILRTFKTGPTGKLSKYDDIDLPVDFATILVEQGFIKEAKLPEGSVYICSLEEISQLQRKPSNKVSQKGNLKDGLHQYSR